VKLVKLIKTYLNETYNKVRIDAFPFIMVWTRKCFTTINLWLWFGICHQGGQRIGGRIWNWMGYISSWSMLCQYWVVSRSFRTKSITKWTTTTINTHWEATQSVMATKVTRLTHKIAIHLHLVSGSCIIWNSRSRRPVWKLLDTPSYVVW
jgi:hypothetical protein